mgnify:CR=1 FL=1
MALTQRIDWKEAIAHHKAREMQETFDNGRGLEKLTMEDVFEYDRDDEEGRGQISQDWLEKWFHQEMR